MKWAMPAPGLRPIHCPDIDDGGMTMKTILITGASTGIGKATAELFFARGWNVVATMRTPKSEREDGRWLVTRLDVTDADSIAAPCWRH